MHFLVLLTFISALIGNQIAHSKLVEIEYTYSANGDLQSIQKCTRQLNDMDIELSSYVDLYIINASGCSQADYNDIINGNAVMIRQDDECSINEKINLAIENKASLLIFAYTKSQFYFVSENLTNFGNDAMPIISIPQTTFKMLLQNQPIKMKVKQISKFSLSKLFLFILAMSSLLIGSVLGGIEWDFLKYGVLFRKGEIEDTDTDISLEGVKNKIILGGYFIFLILIMIGFLLGLYYLHNYFVKIAIFAFCACSAIATYTLLSPFVSKIPFLTWRLPKNKFPILKYRPDPKFFIILLFSFVLPVFWFIFRHSQYSWLLQDLLGAMVITYIVTIIRFKSAIYILIPLLSILVIYDVFFVFITPYFTSDGKSVMEIVAFGSGPSHSKTSQISNNFDFQVKSISIKERIPFLFIVPYIPITQSQIICQFSKLFISGLGFGDVALPGLYITYCLYYDTKLNNKYRPTYISALIGYIIGLISAFEISSWMNSGQPALLYIVPSVFLFSILAAMFRCDLKTFLFGFEETKAQPETKLEAYSLLEIESSSEEAEMKKEDLEKI